MKTFEDYINESKQSDLLSTKINKEMIKIDDSMGIKDFALAVAKILKEEYGSHNFEEFHNIIKKELA